MRVWKTATAVTALGALLLLAGCGVWFSVRRSAWDNLFRDNNAEDLRAVLARIPAPRAAAEPLNGLRRPLVAAVKLGTPAHLVVHDLATNQQLWTREVATIDSRPLIRDDLLLFVAGRVLNAWDLATGAPRWRYTMPADWTFRGATTDAGRLYLAVGKGRLGTVQRRDGIIVCLDARSGGKLWEHTVPFLLGAPAATAGLVFVPWDGQNITVLDGESAREIARLRTRDDLIHFVDARPEGIFYGARGLYRLTERSTAGTVEGSTHRALPVSDIPGNPEFEVSAYELPALSMRKIRFFWAPTPSAEADHIGVVDDTIYMLYFRFLFAYDAETGALRWAFRYHEDIEAVQVVPGGLFLVGRHGDVAFVGVESGSVEWEQALGIRVRSVTFSLDGFGPPERRPAEPPNVRQRLQEVIFDADNRLLPVRTYALSLLTGIEDPEVTQDLLDVHGREGVPEALREAAAQALSERQSGGAYLVDALAIHRDFLLRSEPPPLGIVARTLVRMDVREAVPPLLAHLMDHETPLEDLREVAAAVVALGDASVVGPLRDFLVRYRADSAFAENAEALNVMADGLIRHGHVAERELLERLGADAVTLAPLRQHIGETLASIAAAERDAAAQPEVAPEDTGPTPEEVCAQQREEHYQLTQDEINQVMRSHAAAFRPCFEAEMERNPETGAVRIVWLLSSEGEGMNWDIAPRSTELLTCLLPHLRGIQFPCIRAYRQRARFGVNLVRAHEPEAEPPPTVAPPTTRPTPGGWGPPPPGLTPTPSPTPDGGPVTPDEYPDQYPDEL